MFLLLQIIMTIFGKVLSTKEKAWKSGPALEVSMINHEGLYCTLYSQIEEHNDKIKEFVELDNEENIIFITDVSSSESGMIFINRL